MYEVLITERAKKQLTKLDKTAQGQVCAAIDRLRIRPHAHLTAIVGSNYYRTRAGDYRIIVDVRQSQLIVLVLEIGHRRSIYKG